MRGPLRVEPCANGDRGHKRTNDKTRDRRRSKKTENGMSANPKMGEIKGEDLGQAMQKREREQRESFLKIFELQLSIGN